IFPNTAYTLATSTTTGFGSTAASLIPFFSNNWLSRFTLLIVLPDANDGLPDLLDSMYKHGGISSILSTSFENTKLRLYLPKFKLREGNAIKLKDHLQKLGINDAFCDLSADFSNISDSDRLFISDVIHKAIFEVSQLDICRKHIFLGIVFISDDYVPVLRRYDCSSFFNIHWLFVNVVEYVIYNYVISSGY
ncbi:unnamed protein product, partial [Schistosoma margrebowiei]